jgi:hypothetical protein
LPGGWGILFFDPYIANKVLNKADINLSLKFL